MLPVKYLVVGGGNAAGYAAKAFVKNGIRVGDVAILTDEPYVSYERPALSKGYLLPNVNARLPGFHTCVGGGGEKQDPSWYEQQGIGFMTNTKVSKIDVKAKTVQIESGDSVSYGKLIIATGARPITLQDMKMSGADLQGVHYLRNVEDADKLVAAIKACQAAKEQAVVIGGGYIGMEVAAALALQPLPVTMVFPDTHLMQRLLTPELSAFYETGYRAHGVNILTGAQVVGVEGEGGKVTNVVIKTPEGEQKIPAGLVVVGVGARPNVELLQGQLEMEAGGFKVDGHMRTSNPDVFAIGDVAAFPVKLLDGKHMRQEHVTHARESAAKAVNAAMDLEAPEYDYLPYFYSRIFDFSWQFFGKSAGNVVHFGDYGKDGKPGAYWVEDGKVVGVFLESASAEDATAAKHIVRAKPAAPTNLAERGLAFLKESASL